MSLQCSTSVQGWQLRQGWQQGINNHKWFDHFFREQELDAAGTVKSPSDCCGKSEAAHGNCCKNGYPASICRSKSKDSKLCTGCFSIINSNAAAKDNQCSQCTDHDGICKDFENTEHTLFYRLFWYRHTHGQWIRYQDQPR